MSVTKEQKILLVRWCLSITQYAEINYKPLFGNAIENVMKEEQAIDIFINESFMLIGLHL